MIEVTRYRARDGKEFDDRQDCMDYEEALGYLTLMQDECCWELEDTRVMDIVLWMVRHAHLSSADKR